MEKLARKVPVQASGELHPPLPSRLLSACTVNFTLFTEWILKSLLTPVLKIIILSEDPDGKPLLDYFSQKEALVFRK